MQNRILVVRFTLAMCVQKDRLKSAMNTIDFHYRMLIFVRKDR